MEQEKIFEQSLIKIARAKKLDELMTIKPDIDALPVSLLKLLALQAFVIRQLQLRLDRIEEVVGREFPEIKS